MAKVCLLIREITSCETRNHFSSLRFAFPQNVPELSFYSPIAALSFAVQPKQAFVQTPYTLAL